MSEIVRINSNKLEEMIGCEISVSLEYNCLYVSGGKGKEVVEYLELFGVVGEIMKDIYEDIVDIKNGELFSEYYVNLLLFDGSIKPSFRISIDDDERII